MKLISAHYGIPDKTIDVTEKIMCFFQNDKLYISKETNLNSICGDPSPGRTKKLQLKIAKDNFIYEINLQERNRYLTKFLIVAHIT